MAVIAISSTKYISYRNTRKYIAIHDIAQAYYSCLHGCALLSVVEMWCWSLPHLRQWKSVHDCHSWPLLSTLVACAFSLRSTGHHWQGRVLWRGLGVVCTATTHSWHCRAGASIVTNVGRSVQTVLELHGHVHYVHTVHCTLVIIIIMHITIAYIYLLCIILIIILSIGVCSSS